MADIKSAIDKVTSQWNNCTKHLSRADCDDTCQQRVDKSEHVKTDDAAKPAHVSRDDLDKLRQSAAEHELAAAHYEIAHLKWSLATAHKDINAMRHEAAVEHANKARADAHAHVQNLKDQHHVLAQQLAIQYGVDWKTTSFVPETGELIATPEDNPP